MPPTSPPPFIGQGLVAGLRDAANLSWKLAWVMGGRADARILGSYDEERRPHALRMINLARLMGRFVMPRSSLAAILVHGALATVRKLPGGRRFFDELGIKPANRFEHGLFAGARGGRLPRGGQLPQGLVRAPGGGVMLSDDALGPALTLVGIGKSPAVHLSRAQRDRWTAHGGRILRFALSHDAAPRDWEAYEVLDNAILDGAAPYGWCAVVRPDRTVMADGPVEQAGALVEVSLGLLGTAATYREGVAA